MAETLMLVQTKVFPIGCYRIRFHLLSDGSIIGDKQDIDALFNTVENTADIEELKTLAERIKDVW